MIDAKLISSRLAAIYSCIGTLILASSLGCGGASDGPERFSLNGTVTYDGKPVPTGFITLIPDTAQGNKGPGGGAAIINGQFKTSSGKGSVGGPHLVRIVGYSGVPTQMEGEELPDGEPLFPEYETSVDIPAKNSKLDFQIPAVE